MKNVYIVGEDPVTQEILKRLVSVYAPQLHILGELPARGSELKSKISAFNKLSETYPIVLLSDMDTDDCAPLAKRNLLHSLESQHPDFVVNIAVDEAEAWLLADREGFSRYFDIPLSDMPDSALQKFGGMRRREEMELPLKSSYFLTHFLIKHSGNEVLRKQIMAEGSSCKGPEYNSALCPFIRSYWHPDNARVHSYSLQGTIQRLKQM